MAKTYLAYGLLFFCSLQCLAVQCCTVHGLCYQFAAVVLVMEGQCIQEVG